MRRVLARNDALDAVVAPVSLNVLTPSNLLERR